MRALAVSVNLCRKLVEKLSAVRTWTPSSPSCAVVFCFLYCIVSFLRVFCLFLAKGHVQSTIVVCLGRMVDVVCMDRIFNLVFVCFSFFGLLIWNTAHGQNIQVLSSSSLNIYKWWRRMCDVRQCFVMSRVLLFCVLKFFSFSFFEIQLFSFLLIMISLRGHDTTNKHSHLYPSPLAGRLSCLSMPGDIPAVSPFTFLLFTLLLFATLLLFWTVYF